MKKLTDQELDSLFKNAAEGYEPAAFDQADWEAMNTKLDQPKPIPFWKQWIPFAFLGTVIFSAGVWVGTLINQPTTPVTQASLAVKNKEISQPEKIVEPELQDVKKSETTNEQEATLNNQIAYKQTSNQVNSVAKLDTDKANMQGTQSNNDGNNQIIQLTENSNQVDETEFIAQDQKILKSAGASMMMEQPDPAQPLEKTEEQEKETVQALEEKDKKEEKEKKLSNARGLYVSLLASPDFSSINFSGVHGAGSNYAVLFDYQLSNHWSVSAGGIWSMKKYATEGEVTYGKYTADSMVGACRILDIPVNVYYRFNPQARLSFYAGAGLSSYVMLSEDYTYTFNSPSGSQDFNFYFEKKNNEWFKVLNVSLGAQYQVSPRFNLQVEPFLKAPLQGVGEWDVKLSSVGVFMGVKYRIN